MPPLDAEACGADGERHRCREAVPRPGLRPARSAATTRGPARTSGSRTRSVAGGRRARQRECLGSRAVELRRRPGRARPEGGAPRNRGVDGGPIDPLRHRREGVPHADGTRNRRAARPSRRRASSGSRAHRAAVRSRRSRPSRSHRGLPVGVDAEHGSGERESLPARQEGHGLALERGRPPLEERGRSLGPEPPDLDPADRRAAASRSGEPATRVTATSASRPTRPTRGRPDAPRCGKRVLLYYFFFFFFFFF